MNEQLFGTPEAKENIKPVITWETFSQLQRQKLSQVFKEFSTGQERIDALVEGAEDTLKAGGMRDLTGLMKQLQRCSVIEDRLEFINVVFPILEPEYRYVFEHLADYTTSEMEKRVRVNELLNYDIEDKRLNIHVFSGGLDGQLTRYVDGLRIVAGILKQNQDIETVDATSWIVAQHPRILRRLGFTIVVGTDGLPMTQTVDGDDVGHAFMTREDFLRKYLQENILS